MLSDDWIWYVGLVQARRRCLAHGDEVKACQIERQNLRSPVHHSASLSASCTVEEAVALVAVAPVLFLEPRNRPLARAVVEDRPVGGVLDELPAPCEGLGSDRG